MAGRLFAVVGPSGAGKDSLIDAARRHFGEDGPVRFVRRAITRPADAGGEAHEALDQEAFAERARDGGFALHWDAHGLSYGIPADIVETLDAGRNVLVNLSRAVIPAMRARFPTGRVLVVTASPAILAQRLAARGRESAAEIEARLTREPPHFPDGPDVITIRNNGSLEDAERAFIAALET